MSVPPPSYDTRNCDPSGSASDPDPIEEEALDWLMRVADAPEDGALREGLDAWRRQTPRHDQAYLRVEHVWRLAAALPRQQPGPPRRVSSSRRRYGFAAVAALAAAIVVFLAPGILLNLTADHVTGVGEVRHVVLTDGSRVDLDAETALAVDYGAEQRRVRLLAGKAFFDVAENRGRPFIVATEGLEVTVTGTSFTVSMAQEGASVAVKSGHVRVNSGSDRPGTSSALTALKPGDKAVFSPSDGRISRSRIAPGDVAAWREGLLIADSMPLATVVEQLGRYHRGFIVFRDPALSKAEVTGVFNLRNPLSALQAAAATQGARVVSMTSFVLLIEPFEGASAPE